MRAARFELVVTLGPASWGLVRVLLASGATSFRINRSHMELEEVVSRVEAVRADSDVPIVVDLQGAKMRLGRVVAREVRKGERLRFVLRGDGGVLLPHPEIFASVRKDEVLTMDDARLAFRVTQRWDDALEAVCLGDGTILPRKGVNRADHPISPSDLSAEDDRCVAALSGTPGVGFALSFLSSARELDWVSSRAPRTELVAKIERREAIGDLEAISARASSMWICRGDLGAQLGEPELARVVASIRPSSYGCPVLMAGQVLEHLTHHSELTRSEVCHLGDLAARGYAGIVLSDETAVGVDPVRAVRRASQLMGELWT